MKLHLSSINGRGSDPPRINYRTLGAADVGTRTLSGTNMYDPVTKRRFMGQYYIEIAHVLLVLQIAGPNILS